MAKAVKKKTPKGAHRMPDGSMMSNEEMERAHKPKTLRRSIRNKKGGGKRGY